MGWSYRKSINLGGGARMNISKGGVGYSFGTRGYRVSTGPRGTYVSVGAGGIRYRTRIDGNGSPHNQSHGTITPPSSASPGVYSRETIDTAEVSRLIDAASAATLEELNTRVSQPQYVWFTIAGVVAAALFFGSLNPALFFICSLLGIYPVILAAKSDRMRRTCPLFYELDEAVAMRFSQLSGALGSLASVQRLWRIHAVDHTYDWKRNAGASRLLTRTAASMQRRQPPCIATNVMPFSLVIGAQTLFFMPDRLYVWERGRYGAVDYSNLSVETGTTRFIETDGVPADAQVVDQTWRYVNKKGGPDRRFANNPQIPIALYGAVSMRSGSGLNILLHVSRHGSVDSLAAHFRTEAYTNSTANRNTSSYKEKAQSTAEVREFPNYYAILGLNSDCSSEEASSAYRQLAKAYHPDLVSHLAPEFRMIAEERMKEINSAYSELKRLRGWQPA